MYQFVSLVLLLQATLFYLPCIISRELYRSFGVHPDELALSALEARRSRDPDDRQAAVGDIAMHINAFCVRKLRQGRFSYSFRWLYLVRLSLVQMLTRICYVVNTIGQFYLLDILLGIEFHSIGWSIIGRTTAKSGRLPSLHQFLVKLLENTDAAMDGLPDYIRGVLNSNDTAGILDALANLSVNRDQIMPQLEGLDADDRRENPVPLFPLEVLCDFWTSTLGQLQRYTLHCVLPVNHLNELVFQYVWMLLFGVGVVSCVALFKSIGRLLLFPCWRINIGDRLQDLGLLDELDPDDVRWKIDLFERKFLGVDGTLLFGYVEAGSGDVISDATLASLWMMYAECADDYAALSKPIRTKESVVEDVIKVPTRRRPSPDQDQPFRSVYDPMQPPEVPAAQFDSAPTYSRETAFSKPLDFSEPPDYSSAQRTDFDKLGIDDDFMV